LKEIFKKISIFLQDIKIEHSLFALPFAYLGLFMGCKGWPSFFVFVWVTVAMVSFRTMAMGLNRLLDHKLDLMNPRTQGRALPQGKLRVKLIWIIVLASLMIFELSAYRLGNLCFWLSPIPLVLAWVYPFAKRFTWGSHFVLGLVLGIAPYGAWIAGTQELAWAAFFLTVGVTCWVAGFDMIYALQDIDFDISQGLFSFPAKFGIAKTLTVTRLLHVISVLCWGLAGLASGSGMLYGIGLTLVAFFLIREHRLIRTIGVTKINEAFFHMNAMASITLFLAVMLDVTL